MDIYQQMYLCLFNRVSDALEQLEQRNYGVAEELLRQGQMECEQISVLPVFFRYYDLC